MLLNVFPHLIPGFETCSPSARADSNVPSPCTGLCVQPLGCRNRMNNGCAIGGFISGRVDLDRGGSQAGLIPERRRSFPKAIGIESPGLRRGLFLIQQGSAYLLTWIVFPGVTPRPPRPVTPAETSLTQSEPSPL